MKKKRAKEVACLVAGLTAEDATCFDEILSRLKVASGVNSDADLALKLGLSRSSISTAKTRGMVPPSWIVNVANLFNVSADWLIFGDEKFPEKAPEETQPAPMPIAQATSKNIPDYNKMSSEWVLDLTPTEFKGLWDRYWTEKEWRGGWLQAEITKRFPEFLDWLKKQPEPVFTPSPAAIKMAGQTRHYGLPDQLEDD